MSRRLALACLALAPSLGCTSVGGDSITLNPTLVAVSPTDFAGDVPCTDAAGGMQRYVVTLRDLGTAEEPSDPFTLPSAVVREGGVYRPLSCHLPAAFAFVVAGHRYDAEVDAYDRSDLVALGAGSRTLLDEKTGEWVAPRWTTSCGRMVDGSPAEGPVTAALYLTRFVRGCEPLVDAGTSPTAIRISLDDSLAGLACGDAVGAVAGFEARRVAPLPSESQVRDCGESALFVDLTPGVSYEFELFAFEAGALAPRWGTTCHRKALSGATVDAPCGALVDTGGLRAKSQDLLAALGRNCSELSQITAALVGTEQKKTVPCGLDLTFDDLPTGLQQLTITGTPLAGGPAADATCTVTVEPGVRRDAQCAAP